MDSRPWEWIDTAEGVSALARAVADEPVIGLDTESDSFHHYQEQVCLVQVSTRRTDYLIDPIAAKDLSPLAKPLGDPRREIVLHGSDYDIVCLKRDFAIHFTRIFDTVLAAQLLGYPATGLSALIERHFGVKVSKQHQRDEWYKRPLSESQIRYALTDTRYLLPLREILGAELVAAGRLAWAEEEFSLLTQREWSREPFHPDHFWKIRGVRDLGRREQGVLRELAVLRDGRSRAVNRPPFKVIPDQTLTALAHAKPKNEGDLKRVRGMSPLMIRRFGEEILEAIRRGLSLPENDLPVATRGERRQGDPAANRRLEALKEWRRKKAESLKLDPGVLAPQSTLQALARSGIATPSELESITGVTRWRLREFGAEWVAVMNPAR
ncbi:MAG: ribonuclease D [Acidobacteria bacterium]|nr:ribonuclease D [Acidobacteriota bacterium]